MVRELRVLAVIRIQLNLQRKQILERHVYDFAKLFCKINTAFVRRLIIQIKSGLKQRKCAKNKSYLSYMKLHNNTRVNYFVLTHRCWTYLKSSIPNKYTLFCIVLEFCISVLSRMCNRQLFIADACKLLCKRIFFMRLFTTQSAPAASAVYRSRPGTGYKA